jgi:hypothetical protein
VWFPDRCGPRLYTPVVSMFPLLTFWQCMDTLRDWKLLEELWASIFPARSVRNARP